MYLPLSVLGFTACGDVLNVGHNTIHGGSLSAVCCWALRSVVTGLVALEAGNSGQVPGVSPICVWGGGVIDSRPRVLVSWSGACLSCTVHFEEGPNDDCPYSFYCCVILGESCADHYGNSSDRIDHPDHRHTDDNRCFPGTGHRDSDHGGRPISVGCRFGNRRRLDGNRRHSAAYPAIGVARYPSSDRIVARPNKSMYSWARSGKPGPSLCG